MDFLTPGTPAPSLRHSWVRGGRGGLRSWLLVGLMVLVGVLLTGFVWRNARDTQRREAEAYLDFRVRDSVQRIQTRLHAYEQVLLGGRGLFEAAQAVDRTTWRRYAANLDLDRNYPGIQGLGFALWVPPEAKARHIEAVRREGFPTYDLRPPGERSAYSAIIFLEPFQDRNLRAFGYDMFAEPVRRQAMAIARDERRPTLSGKVTLVQETGAEVQAGFLLYVPVYWPGRPLGSPEERRTALRGWVYAPFRMNDFMSGVLGEQANDLDLEIYDGEFVSAAALLFDSSTLPHLPSGPQRLEYLGVMNSEGHPWTVALRTLPSFQRHLYPTRAPQILAVGLVMSGLLGVLTWSLSRAWERAEQLAQDRESLFRATFEQAAVGIIHVSLRECVLQANQRFCDLLGYTAEEVLDAPIDRFTQAEDRDLRRASRDRLHRGEIPFINLETRFIKKDGQALWVNLTGSLVAAAPGRPAFFVAVIEDISARKRVEAALAESEERLRGVVEGSPVAIFLHRDGRFLYLNSAGVRLLGASNLETLVGQPVLDRVHPDSREAVRQRVANSLQTGEGSPPVEERFLTLDGTVREVEVQGGSIFYGGQPAVLAFAQDISERKATAVELARSEKSFRQVFEGSPSAMSLSRVEDGLVRRVNEAWIQLFGWSREEAQGRSLVDLGVYANPEDRARLRAAVQASGRVSGWPLDTRRKDGGLMQMRLGLTEIDFEGEACYLTVLLDFTTLHEAETALHQLNQTLELQVASELARRLAHEHALIHQSRLAAMGEMVGNIAHQWRQPLNALAMVLANLQDARGRDARNDEYFASSLKQGNALVQKMSTTISDFIDFFRPNKTMTRFSLRQQVEQALHLVVPSLAHHEVVVELQPGPEAWVLGHPNECSQVLLNLLTNAREAIDGAGVREGLVRIVISTEDHQARLCVADNGGGITVTPIERIFEPYFTDKPTGTGLGLYMSRMILEQSMQGRIEARNIPGGAEFSILIPLAEA